MFRLTRLLLTIVTATVCGCADPQPTTKAPGKPTTKPTSVTKPAAEVTNQEPPSKAKSANEYVVKGTTATQQVDDPAMPERILLLALGGPLILDVLLTIDGHPYGRAVELLIDQVVSAGDTNDDGKSTWSEWGQNEDFLHGELASLNPIRRRTVDNWVKRYDENSDGQIQRAEAASWLGRDAGQSASGLRLRSSRSYAALNVKDSRLWQTLDTDQDGQLSVVELAATTQRLFELDTDDNRIVDATELESLREQLDAQRQLRSSFERTTRRDAAVRLRKPSDASELDYLLSDLYAPRQQLGPTSFSARTGLFKALDSDDDQLLDGQELAALLTIEPHAKLAVKFDTKDATATLTLLDHASEIVSSTKRKADRMIVKTADSRLTLLVDDFQGRGGEQSVLDANEISLMIHDRADVLYETLDANSDGRLGEREITQAALHLMKADSNGNGNLSASELHYSMTIVFARAEPGSQRSFYLPQKAVTTDYDSNAPTWYRHADLNADGDVSRREFLGDDAQFFMLDTDRDGFVSAIEAADATNQ